MLARHNKSQSPFNIEFDGKEFKTLEELLNLNGKSHKYPINAFYINTKSEYGEQAVIVTDDLLVDTPHYMVDEFKDILNNEEEVQSIIDGNEFFTIRVYDKKLKSGKVKKCFTIDFC